MSKTKSRIERIAIRLLERWLPELCVIRRPRCSRFNIYFDGCLMEIDLRRPIGNRITWLESGPVTEQTIAGRLVRS